MNSMENTNNNTPVIEVSHLTKYYGNFPAVHDISFNINKGEVVGFLGPNGAGKTTTMKVLTGFMPPTGGTVKIAGYDALENSLEIREKIGYLPESVPLYTDMTVTEYLSFMGSIRGMKKNKLSNQIANVIEQCRLGDYRHTIIGKLSKGYRQRVGVAQAVIHEPEVLVLDEPTIGIDPIQVVETRKLIKELGENDRTLILSTHILPEVSMLCKRILIIHQGKIVAEDTPDNLSSRLKGAEQISIEVKGPEKQIQQTIEKINGVEFVKIMGNIASKNIYSYMVQVEQNLDLRSTISKTIINNGWELLKLQNVDMSLEEIFLKLTTQEEF